MNDPGLPPRPRSLNLLESLVKEEEAKEQIRSSQSVVIPTETRESASPEFYDKDKQQLTKETSANKSFSEFKMKDTDKSSKVQRADPHAGFRGKKIKKQRPRSGSSDRFKSKSKTATRPFSADYNQTKRNKLSANDGRKGRPKTTKGRKMNNRTSSPKGQRPRSPHSYSSDTYSSDDEYIKRERFRSNSKSPESDSFFDSDQDKKKKPGSPVDSDNESDKERNARHKESKRSSSSSSSSSDSSSSDEDYREKNKQMNGHGPHRVHRIERQVSKTVYADKNGKQRTKYDSESSDHQRMVVVDDYSSTSEDESKKNEIVSKPPQPVKKTKPLLSRKKRQGYKVFQVNPDLYIEGKLHQKYTELEELMSCSFVDQKSHVTRHHLYQMELLRDQYQNASHGQRSAHAIIPHSLPEEIRNRSSRPTSAKYLSRRIDSDQDSATYETAYGTLRSVMTAERARNSNRIRTDIHADRPNSAKRTGKKKKKIEATYKAGKSDTEEEISERPSFSSKASSSPRTPRPGPSVDDHIKYSKNEKLKKWLKEKDKIYRQHIKEEKRKKREEREKLVNEANEKFESRLKSQKVVKKWMKEKSKEWIKIQKEKRMKEREDDEWLESYKKTKSVPGDTLRIRPQSAPAQRPEDGDTEKESLKEKIHAEREDEEEKKQAKLAKVGPHPPQTKFIYKRPVAGKIKLKLQVRGKSPTPAKNESGVKESKVESEDEKAKQMRLSYDDWVKKKRSDDIIKKENAKRQRELAKSDPELERIIPALGKKRIENKLNMRKKIDTGIKKFDDKTNKSFGGGEFDGEVPDEKERPRNAYRLEGEQRDSGESGITVKQLQRPSTAPSGRGKVPSPQKSASSPRKAVIPQRVDKVMASDDTCNPYTLPFPPDKGIPPHVAERQRKLFADQVTNNLDEIEQRALLNAELIKEGVSEAHISAVASLDDKAFEQYKAEREVEAKGGDTEEDKHPKITELMYSPRKQEDSSSSSDENAKEETNDNIESDENVKEETDDKNECSQSKSNEESRNENAEKEIHTQEVEKQSEDKENKEGDQIATQTEASDNGHSHYKTYDNLNELALDTENKHHDEPEDHLKEAIETLKQRVEQLHIHLDSSSTDSAKQGTKVERQEGGVSEMSEGVKITVVTETDSDPNIVGILKESKRENMPAPESSEEPELRQNKSSENNIDSEEPGSPQEDSGNFRKRVSFNEHTEVFQSFESTSTDTVTPDQEDFDVQAESLDAQQGYDDDDNDDRPDILKLQGQKMTINIGGFDLNPTVIKQEEKDDSNGDTNSDQENKNTFITNPDDETGGSD